MKLTGLTALNTRALTEVFPGPADSDEYVTVTKSTATFSDTADAHEWLRRLNEKMAAMPDHRHHPYASLHAVCRKLHALDIAESADERQAVVDEIVAEGLRELDKPQEADGPAEAPEVQEEAPVTDDDPVAAKVAEKVAALRQEIAGLQAREPQAQAEYDAAWDSLRRIHPDRKPPVDFERRADRASSTLSNILDGIRSREQQIERLQSPQELERRRTTTARLTEVRKVAATKKKTAREQGVPDIYLAESGNFKPGLDARYKSDLVHSALGLESDKTLQTYEAEDATKRLKERGWTKFLDQKQKSLEAKTKAAERKAAAKAKSEAEAAAEPTDNGAAPEAKSDPKPTRRRRAKAKA